MYRISPQILQTPSGQLRDHWETCQPDEEPVVIQQFLRFPETRQLAQSMLAQNTPPSSKTPLLPSKQHPWLHSPILFNLLYLFTTRIQFHPMFASDGASRIKLTSESMNACIPSVTQSSPATRSLTVSSLSESSSSSVSPSAEQKPGNQVNKTQSLVTQKPTSAHDSLKLSCEISELIGRDCQCGPENLMTSETIQMIPNTFINAITAAALTPGIPINSCPTSINSLLPLSQNLLKSMGDPTNVDGIHPEVNDGGELEANKQTTPRQSEHMVKRQNKFNFQRPAPPRLSIGPQPTDGPTTGRQFSSAGLPFPPQLVHALAAAFRAKPPSIGHMDSLSAPATLPFVPTTIPPILNPNSWTTFQPNTVTYPVTDQLTFVSVVGKIVVRRNPLPNSILNPPLLPDCMRKSHAFSWSDDRLSSQEVNTPLLASCIKHSSGNVPEDYRTGPPSADTSEASEDNLAATKRLGRESAGLTEGDGYAQSTKNSKWSGTENEDSGDGSEFEEGVLISEGMELEQEDDIDDFDDDSWKEQGISVQSKDNSETKPLSDTRKTLNMTQDKQPSLKHDGARNFFAAALAHSPKSWSELSSSETDRI
ncbi:hypothetical protein AHF37_03511 [Paragonimus kellicotti]|nr:hypothetical protein AHF37_03511 [Paragonimus kellicotti]